MYQLDLKALKAAANAAKRNDHRLPLTCILLKGSKVAATDSYICFEAESGADISETGEDGWMFPASVFLHAKTTGKGNEVATFELCNVAPGDCQSSWKVTFNDVTTIVTAWPGDGFPRYQGLFKDYAAPWALQPAESFCFTVDLVQKAMKVLKIKGGKGAVAKATFNGAAHPCVMHLAKEPETRVLLMHAKED